MFALQVTSPIFYAFYHSIITPIWQHLLITVAIVAGAEAEGTVGAHGGGYGLGGHGGIEYQHAHEFGPYLSGYEYGIGYGNEGFDSAFQYVYSHIGYNRGDRDYDLY